MANHHLYSNICFFLFSGVADNAKDLNEFIKFVKGVSAFIIIILGMAVFRFYKNYKKRKQRKWCIENALYSVEGIHNIAGMPIDHSFLRYKKELTEYGYEVEKISMKEQRVSFKKIEDSQYT